MEARGITLNNEVMVILQETTISPQHKKTKLFGE